MNDKLSEEILTWIRQHDGPIQTFILKKRISIQYTPEEFDESLWYLIDNNVIEYTNQGLQLKTRTLQQIIDESDLAVKQYFQGITLADIAARENKTVDEIREHIRSQLKEPLAEDKYRADFEKYKISIKNFIQLYNETKVTYRYLNIKYEQGKEEIGLMLDDPDKTVSFKEQVNNITKNTVEVEGESIPVNPTSILTYLLRKRKESVKPEAILKEYNRFVEEKHLRNIESLSISPGTINAISGKENNILYDKGGKLRYYPFDKKEVLALIESLNLSQYSNMYISSLLIFKNSSNLMESYDIQNEHQLYNLLSKYSKYLGKYRMKFVRIPSISFGKGDDFTQIERLLKTSGKILTDDFYNRYEELYGIKSTTTRSSYSAKLRKYLDGEYYNYNLPRLKERQLNLVSTAFNKPWYPIEDAKMIFSNKLGELGDIYFNSINLDLIGYCIGTDIIYSKKYMNTRECLEDQILNQERIKITDDMLKKYTTLRTLVNNKKKQLDLIPISNDEYLSSEFLKGIGLTKAILSSYATDILSTLNVGQYFTLNYLRFRNFSHEIDDYGFDDIFYRTLIESNPSISYGKLHNVQIFTYDTKYNKDEAIESMVAFALEEKNSMDEYELSSKIKEIYGVDISSELTSGKPFYYNERTMKVYRDKESFYEELRNYDTTY